MKGTRVSAITFSAIDHFDRIFEPFKRYYVTSAAVKVADPRYKVGEYNYTWTLYPQTHVQLLDDPVPYVCPYSFDFMKFSDMFRVADRDVSIVAKGLIVHSYDVPHATKHLSETASSLMKSTMNVQEIGQLIQQEAYKSTDILLPPPAATDIVPIRDVSMSMDTLKTAWVAATIHLMPAQERLWHAVCDKCKKTVNLPIGSDLPCMYCKKEMNVEPRCHVHVFLNDESGTLSATLFSSTAENFIGFTAAELFEANEKNAPLNDEIARKIDKKPVLCFLKYYERTLKNKAEKIYPVVKLYTEEEANSGKVHSAYNLIMGAIASTAQGCTSVAAEKEQQLFSLSTKKVIEEIATTFAMDQGTMLPSASAKRGIIFDNTSGEKVDVLIFAKVPFPTHEIVVQVSGRESPVKKLKNKVSDN